MPLYLVGRGIRAKQGQYHRLLRQSPWRERLESNLQSAGTAYAPPKTHPRNLLRRRAMDTGSATQWGRPSHSSLDRDLEQPKVANDPASFQQTRSLPPCTEGRQGTRQKLFVRRLRESYYSAPNAVDYVRAFSHVACMGLLGDVRYALFSSATRAGSISTPTGQPGLMTIPTPGAAPFKAHRKSTSNAYLCELEFRLIGVARSTLVNTASTLLPRGLARTRGEMLLSQPDPGTSLSRSSAT